MDEKDVLEIKNRYSRELMRRPKVNGVGTIVLDGVHCVHVWLTSVAEPSDNLPATLEGARVVYEVLGEIIPRN